MMDYTSLGCCALAFVLYLNTLNSGFVYDDRRAILANTDVSGSAPWQNAFLHDYWGTPLTDSGSHGSYRPLSVLTFRLNFLLSGYNPWGFHLVNNLLHCLATGLVVKVARHFLSSVWGVVATGALFAAHPIHTEAVAGIVGRADLAACVCYLLSFLTYMRHIAWRERGDPLQWVALSLTLVSSMAALLFKETAISALLICGMFDVIRGLSGLRDKHRLRSVCVLTSVLLGTVYCRLAVIPRPQTLFSTADNPIAKTNSWWTRCLTFLYLPVFNFKLMLNPQVLSFDWGMNAIPRITSLWDGRNVLSMTFYGTLSYTAWHSCCILWRRHQRLQKHSRPPTSYHTQRAGVGAEQYHVQPQMQRKSRTKRKYCKQMQCQTTNGATVTATATTTTPATPSPSSSPTYYMPHYTAAASTATTSTSSYLKHKLLGISNASSTSSICGDCKQELSSAQHTNTCRVLNNNNNVLTLSHSNVYHTACCCHQLMSSSVAPPQLFSFVLHKAIASVVSSRSSRSSSSCSNSTTASNKSSGSSASSTCSSGSSLSSKSSNSKRSSTKWSLQHHHHHTRHSEDFMLHHMPQKCANASVLLMAVAFLTLPFLPATNLVFYVGFVVAERLLYLPSIGFCLLVGFGFGKLMDHLRTSKSAARNQQMLLLSLCLVLSALSARTIRRNLDWRDEESLYRSAVQINPPKALGNLGSVLSSQARYKEAEEVLLEAIKYRPNMADVHFNLRAILANTDVSGSAPWQNAFLHDYWGTPLTDSGSHGSYRPLSVLTFRLNFLLSGYNPWGFHLVNNLLHCLATGLVVKVARHFLSSVWGVVATGALFAAHPIHTEAVAGIVGRADLAACVCYLLSFLTYMRHIAWRERGDPLQWVALSLTLVSSMAALLFKETAISALLICGMFDVIRGLSGLRDKHRLRSVCVLTSVLLGTVYCRLAVIPRPQTLFSTADNPIAKTNSWWTRCLTFLYLPVFNFKLMLNPQVLSFDWGMNAIPRITSLWDGRNVLSMTFYGTLSYTAWHSCCILWRRHQRLQKHSRPPTSYHTQRAGVGAEQYHVQPQMQRKSRTKRKYCKQMQCQTTNGATVTATTTTSAPTPSPSPTYYMPHYAAAASTPTTSTSSYLKHKLLGISNASSSTSSICGDCKQELSSAQHTNTCRVLNNNNNVLTLSHSNVYHTACCCHQLMSSSVAPPQLFSFVLHKAIASVVSSRSSRSSSSCSNSTTASNKSSGSSASSTCSSGSSLSSKSSNSQRSSTKWSLQHHHHHTRHSEDFMLHHMPQKCANASVLLMAVAFLTLPFLPATNLVFYVGFVVAERLLYLPSIGFCLLVGFGFGKLMDHLRTSKSAARNQQMLLLSLCLVLSALSARTIRRNLDWRDEESLYRSAVQINPPKALGNLGSVLSSQARYKEAEEVLLEAIKYRPNMADVHFNLGILYQNQQNFKNAVKSFKNALNFRPNLAVAYLNLGISLIALGKCQEAAQILQEGSKVDGTGVRDRVAHENARISSYLQLGALYVEQGKLQRALAVYREALHELPNHYYKRDVLYHRIGDIFGRLQQWDEAERHHRAALELQPNQVAAHLSYGVTLARNSSRVSEAEMWFKRALQLAPEEASVYHHYAEFLTTQSRLVEAIAYRVKAAELSPQDYSLVVAAATALRLLDRKQEAEIWYRKAVNIRPSDAHAHTNLGAILHLLGHTSKAAASYKEALRLQPGDATTIGNLAKLGLTETK